MLFNSYAFLFVFLPTVLLIFYGLRGCGRLSDSVPFLALASVAFYAYWRPQDTFILVGAILFNFFAARAIATAREPHSKWLLTLSVAANLGLLTYFKYFDFLASNLAALVGLHFVPRGIVMPIGISFFTFTQIAYLVDCYRSRAPERRFSSYALFVTIFPHLIAGPIIHHSQMRPQFARLRTEPVEPDFIVLGVVIFVLGLAKKVLLADNLVSGADLIFNAADHGAPLTPFMAWFGTIAYTLQIYFDFSGYSDMAIGLGLLFGLRLPLNFNSPYKSPSIIEFWRRWHMTLSAWLRDYVYIPLGGNRGGEFGRLRNVFLTFLLGGFWHGAGWTFIIWGALHGTYVVINHLLRKARGFEEGAARPAAVVAFNRITTLLIVMLAWVFFRAKTLGGAWAIVTSMAGLAPHARQVAIDGALYFWVTLAAALALFAPNTQQLTRYTAKLDKPLRVPVVPLFGSVRRGSPSLGVSAGTAILCGMLFAAALACICRPAIFIYFNF
jgi:alginate O-acetyltransferase complex protein AlgI